MIQINNLYNFANNLTMRFMLFPIDRGIWFTEKFFTSRQAMIGFHYQKQNE